MLDKKIYVGLCITTILLILITGCYKDFNITPNSNQTVVVTKNISYKGDILPLFAKSCSMSGCHASGGKKPDLSQANAFSSLSSGNYLNTSAPETSELYLWLTGKRGTVMPPNGVDPAINGTILAWIKQGAKSDN